MARIYQTGFEASTGQYTGGGSIGSDRVSDANNTYVTSPVRGGGSTGAFRASGTSAAAYLNFTLSTTMTPVYITGFIWVESFPSSETAIVQTFGNSSSPTSCLTLDASGVIRVRQGNVIGTVLATGPTITTNSGWLKIQIYLYLTVSTASGYWKLNDVQLYSGTDLSTGASVTGFVSATISPGSSGVLYCDDWAVNDTTGSVNNAEIDDVHIVYLAPISDSQAGAWAGGGGGTTNLYDALNNTPPTGAATPGTNTSQIRTNTGTNSATNEYRANLTTYANAGVLPGSQIVAAMAWMHDGEEVSTGNKTITIQFYSNPNATAASYTVGPSNNAVAAFPTYWALHNTIIESPTLTLDTSPILAVRKTDSGTRYVAVCGLGMYVDIKPPVPDIFMQPLR